MAQTVVQDGFDFYKADGTYIASAPRCLAKGAPDSMASASACRTWFKNLYPYAEFGDFGTDE